MRAASTPSPTASTKPAPSLCGTTRGNGIVDPSHPRRFFVSPGFTPESEMRTRTSPAPGTGAGISPVARTSAAGPCRSYQAASTDEYLCAFSAHRRLQIGSRCVARLVRRRPTRQEVQRLLRLRARLCHVDVDRQARIGCELEAVVVEAEVADDLVVQVLDPGAVEAHIVRRPQCAELVALGREFADE